MKNYAIIADGNYEYDISVIQTDESTSFEMRYSQSEQWTSHTRGEHIMSATDHGDGIKFTQKFKKSFDYDFFCELKIFTDFVYNYGTGIGSSYEIYEKQNNKKIN